VLAVNRRVAEFGVYLVSVSGGHQADLAGMDRRNRNRANILYYSDIGAFTAISTT
jgi:hypothetical protein